MVPCNAWHVSSPTTSSRCASVKEVDVDAGERLGEFPDGWSETKGWHHGGSDSGAAVSDDLVWLDATEQAELVRCGEVFGPGIS
jgi:hypothetical protein